MATTISDADLRLAEEAIRKCKLQLMVMNDTVFFASLLANLKLIIDESKGTAATDGVHLWMNPHFAAAQSSPKLLGLMLHEVLHCAFQHMDRRITFGLDARIWNIAGDFYINLYLTQLGYSLPPTDCLDYKYAGMGTREIYDELMKDPPPDDDDFEMDIIFAGSGDDGDEETEGLSADDIAEQATTNVIKAVMQADLAGHPGSVPGEIRTLLEPLLNPKLPWEVIFQNHMSKHAKDDYDWSRPNKRYMPDFYFPNMKSDALNEIFFARDVSGSMYLHWLEAITSEMQYVWDTLQPLAIRIMDFDVIVHRDETYSKGDTFAPVELFGGGGTEPEPCIQAIREDSPEIAVIFTDGDFYMPDLSNLYTDLVWIIVNNPSFTAPYGTVIHFEV